MRGGRTLIKICGLCSAEDARAAVDAGASALGVVFADSPRRVNLDEAVEILADAPTYVTRVGVFVDATPAEIVEAVDSAHLSAVQLHGSESAELCAALPVPVIKSFRVGEGYDVAAIEPYRDVVMAVLLDTSVEGMAGGTGRTFEWGPGLLPADLPVIVAGGLTPENVGEAVRVLRPFAVDVSSGVEERHRVKDLERMAAFVAAVRAAEEAE